MLTAMIASLALPAATPSSDLYTEAEFIAGPEGEGNVVKPPQQAIVTSKIYEATQDGGMAVVDPSDALIGYDAIFSTQNALHLRFLDPHKR